MADDRLGQILAELSAGEEAWTSARLCDAFSAVAGVTGAGVMLMSGDVQRGSLSVSDEVSRQMEELQYTFGEGPCLDAYQQDRIVAEPDLADPLDLRWLAFSPAALQAGIRAVFGFPLQVGAVRLGALNLYRDRPGPLSGEQHADTVVLAGVAAHWVLQTQSTANPGMLATELKAEPEPPAHRCRPGRRRRHPRPAGMDRAARPAPTRQHGRPEDHAGSRAQRKFLTG